MAQPGERWLYNTGAQVARPCCASAPPAQRAFADVLQSRLLRPLGMTQTGFFASDPSPAGDGLRQNP